MARPRSRHADFAVYLAVRVVVLFVQILPWSLALALARGLGRLAHRIDRRHRAVAAENLRHAFPEKSTEAIDSLVWANYRHWATVVIEIMRLPRTLHSRNLENYFAYSIPGDLDRGYAWLKRPGPKLFLTGHFGNFEAMSYMLGLFGARGPVVARRLDNPFLDRFLRRFREKTGQEILDKNRDYNRILDALNRGETLGMLADQDAGPRGVFVDFFGRPASTFKSIAVLSLEHNASILVVGAARVAEPMRFHLHLEDLIEPAEHSHDPDPIRSITQRYTKALERLARRHPEQYFWLHRRWKHQPKAKSAKTAA